MMDLDLPRKVPTKVLEMGSKLFGKTAPEGAEASLWAATSTDIFEGNWKDYQVCTDERLPKDTAHS